MLKTLTDEIDIPWKLKLIATIGFTALLAYFVVSIYSRQQQDHQCYTTAKDWLYLKNASPGSLYDPKQTEFFAKNLAAYQLACPTGHIIISQNEQRTIPDAVVQLAKQGQIIEAARRDLAQQAKRNQP